jgi:hypothetical protein
MSSLQAAENRGQDQSGTWCDAGTISSISSGMGGITAVSSEIVICLAEFWDLGDPLTTVAFTFPFFSC